MAFMPSPIKAFTLESRAIYRLAPINAVHGIITDVGFDEASASSYAETGVPVTRVVPDEMPETVNAE